MTNATSFHDGYTSASPLAFNTITSTSENEYCECAQYFREKQNNIKVLMAMSVGLTYKDGTILNDFKKDPFPKKKLKQFIPGNQILVEEILRRKKVKGENAKVNMQMKQSVSMDWLENNPVENEEDVTFVLRQVEKFLDTYLQMEKEKTNRTRDQWAGIAPFIRLIHCLIGNEKTMETFQNSFKTLSREELDGRKNSGSMRCCPWDLISRNFNNKDFNPKSTIYSDLHDDFMHRIDISHSKIASMGMLTPNKAKAKFSYLKNSLLIVKKNWEKSGNGDGTAVICDSSISSDEHVMIDANDKRLFLNGKSPAVLYLWEKANEHNLLNTVCQQLNDEAAFDSAVDTAAKSIEESVFWFCIFS